MWQSTFLCSSPPFDDSDRRNKEWSSLLFLRLEEELFLGEKAGPVHLKCFSSLFKFLILFISVVGGGLAVQFLLYLLSYSSTFDVLWRETQGPTAHSKAGLNSPIRIVFFCLNQVPVGGFG